MRRDFGAESLGLRVLGAGLGGQGFVVLFLRFGVGRHEQTLG